MNNDNVPPSRRRANNVAAMYNEKTKNINIKNIIKRNPLLLHRNMQEMINPKKEDIEPIYALCDENIINNTSDSNIMNQTLDTKNETDILNEDCIKSTIITNIKNDNQRIIGKYRRLKYKLTYPFILPSQITSIITVIANSAVSDIFSKENIPIFVIKLDNNPRFDGLALAVNRLNVPNCFHNNFTIGPSLSYIEGIIGYINKYTIRSQTSSVLVI
eukprot:GHVL01036816.1.p2 GENE.GHVL01036816.1~~GHVL01036816.1.p2  ORF type:complete len:233 (-),score=83.51 GHVL01036816.1:3967-4614(-)